ncbi:lysozyme inhibitor LprI family protein [Rossellomorea sp. AcN35-11]|nr:DUF1311 domain-containing protein [Rossellomorea aquimaris]WJV29830.1 lysozyme inhibitor LprI family protein [Rossellomorea sp. AcN35-11]
MKKSNVAVAPILTMSLVLMSACGSSPEESASNDTIPASTSESPAENQENQQPEDASLEESNTQADSGEEENPPPLTKVAGKEEYLNKLDNIQKELDAMPDKKDSDKGVTNAMKNVYGKSYEMYDQALNDLYAVLKKELSPEVMEELQAEQVKWIKEKEDRAHEERLKYEGGTFEHVAFYISLYESTKERCYELVNEYMVD